MTIRSSHIGNAYIALIQKHGGALASQMLSTFLEKKKITALIPQIQAHIRAYVKKQSVHDTLRVTVPHQSSQMCIDTIVDYTHRTARSLSHAVEVQIDPQIIGGFMTTFRGVATDASVRGILHTLQTK